MELNKFQAERVCRKCEKCGTKVGNGDRFCSKCGNPIPEQTAEIKSEKNVVTEAKTKAPKGKGKMLIAIVALVVIVAAIFVVLTGSVNGGKMSNKEHEIYRAIDRASDDIDGVVKVEYFINGGIGCYIAGFSLEDLGIDFASRTKLDIPSGKELIQKGANTYNAKYDKVAQTAVDEFARAYVNEVTNGTATFRIGYKDYDYVQIEWLKPADVVKAFEMAKASLDYGAGYNGGSGNYMLGDLYSHGTDLKEKDINIFLDKYVRSNSDYKELSFDDFEEEYHGDGTYTYQYENWRIIFPNKCVEGLIVDPYSKWIEVSGKNAAGNNLSIYFEYISDTPILLYDYNIAPGGVNWLSTRDVSKYSDSIANSTIGEVKYK